MEQINLTKIFLEETEKLIVEKGGSKEGGEPVLNNPLYQKLQDNKYNWAALMDKMPGWSGSSASDRSLFGKKANRKVIDGTKHGFTEKELEHLETAFSDKDKK